MFKFPSFHAQRLFLFHKVLYFFPFAPVGMKA